MEQIICEKCLKLFDKHRSLLLMNITLYFVQFSAKSTPTIGTRTDHDTDFIPRTQLTYSTTTDVEVSVIVNIECNCGCVLLRVTVTGNLHNINYTTTKI